MIGAGTNVDRPRGFRPTRTLDGSPITCNSYPVAAANTAMGIGDVVVRTNAGVVDIGAASATQIVGIAAEAKAASAGGYMLVYDNPMTCFAAQTDDGTGTATAQTACNLNINFVATASSGGMSRMELDENTANTTSTLPFTLLRLYPAPGNDLGEFNVWEVCINNHVLKSLGTTGV